MRNVIVDTDIGPDCDDAAALAIVNLLADRGFCKILGIAHCTSNPYGAGTIDAINRYYGRPDIDISTYYGKDFLNEECYMRYNRYIAEHLPNRYWSQQPEDAVRMYRRVLSSQDDQSVECIAIGPLKNLSELLDSRPDEYSQLDGRSLVKQKVTRLTLMGGIFRTSSEDVNRRAEEYIENKIEDFPEWNVAMDLPSAQNVADNWPTPKVYIGLEAGLVLTGQSLREAVPENHPVRLAYQLFYEKIERYSWDLVTVEFALADDCPHYRLSAGGTVRFDEKGRTLWQPYENGNDHFVELAQPEDSVANDLNALLATPPRGGFPT